MPDYETKLEPSEIHEIMTLLRGSNAKNDGDYRSIHLGTVLEYLYNQQTENKVVTLQKLALMLGMAQRQIRENYVDGLLAFGIIALEADCHKWYWVGLKAIKNQFGRLRTNTSEDNSFVARALKVQKEEEKRGIVRE